jgi:hypothetical protein
MVRATWFSVLFLPWAAGCAITTTAPDGSRTIAGLVYITLSPESPPAADEAASLRTRALGLVLMQAESGTVLSLGWADTTLAYARGSACLAIDARH